MHPRMVDQEEAKGKALPARKAQGGCEDAAGVAQEQLGAFWGAVQETQVGGDLVADEDASASPATKPRRDRCRRIVRFRPGAIFAFVRWAANDYGTVSSRIDIVRAVGAGEPFTTLPFVRPGGDILLKIESWRQVERVLQAIDSIERLGIDPAAVSPDHWRHVHNRLTAGHEPRAYTLEHHRAFLLRRRAEP
mgnify:CR=1 FL=1